MVSSLSMPSCGFERYTGPSMLAAWKFIVGPRMPTRFSSIFRDVARTLKGGSPADTNNYDRFDAPIALNTREVEQRDVTSMRRKMP